MGDDREQQGSQEGGANPEVGGDKTDQQLVVSKNDLADLIGQTVERKLAPIAKEVEKIGETVANLPAIRGTQKTQQAVANTLGGNVQLASGRLSSSTGTELGETELTRVEVETAPSPAIVTNDMIMMTLTEGQMPRIVINQSGRHPKLSPSTKSASETERVLSNIQEWTVLTNLPGTDYVIITPTIRRGNSNVLGKKLFGAEGGNIHTDLSREDLFRLNKIEFGPNKSESYKDLVMLYNPKTGECASLAWLGTINNGGENNMLMVIINQVVQDKEGLPRRTFENPFNTREKDLGILKKGNTIVNIATGEYLKVKEVKQSKHNGPRYVICEDMSGRPCSLVLDDDKYNQMPRVNQADYYDLGYRE